MTARGESVVRVGHLYPDLLSAYGDDGNVLVLEQRLRWRGIAVEIVRITRDAAIPTGCDLLVLGGGEDAGQAVAAEPLRRGLSAAVEAGTVVFAVCAGLQLVGEWFEVEGGRRVEGAGVADLRSGRLAERAVGEVAGTLLIDGLSTLTGFSNHAGATRLGARARPLAEVTSGPGNRGPGSEEGFVQDRLVGTYLHGPVLARNPSLADHLLALATGGPLAELADRGEQALREDRLRLVGAPAQGRRHPARRGSL